jgi:hypothetical protein
MVVTVHDAARPGWRVAINLKDTLSRACPNLRIEVFVDYGLTTQYPQEIEEAYFIVVRDKITNAIRFRRRVPLQELMSDEGHNLLMSQLWLVEP